MSFLDDYEPVENRLRQFWEEHPYGRVITTLEYHTGGDYIVRAEVYVGNELRNDPPTATGYAHDSADQLPANMKASALEVCETSAIGRALANMGYAPKGKRPSREEMQKTAAPVTDPPDSKQATQEPIALGGASSPAVQGTHSDATSVAPESAPAEGFGEGPDAGAVPTLEGTDELATDEQWHNLLDLSEGSKVRATNRINKANHTNYTVASAREGATWQELVKAMA